MTNTNELIRFNQFDLNELANFDYRNFYRSRKALYDVSTTPIDPGINWVLYSQNIFPSIRNEFVSGTERPDYDNNYWRNERLVTFAVEANDQYAPSNPPKLGLIWVS